MEKYYLLVKPLWGRDCFDKSRPIWVDPVSQIISLIIRIPIDRVLYLRSIAVEKIDPGRLYRCAIQEGQRTHAKSTGHATPPPPVRLLGPLKICFISTITQMMEW
jgi:hypothetical protein